MKGYIEIHVVKNVRLYKNFAIYYVICHKFSCEAHVTSGFWGIVSWVFLVQ